MAAESVGKDENTSEDKSEQDQLNDESENADSDETEKVEERMRVDRRKLENMLQAALDGDLESGEHFFKKIEDTTNTKISWPSKLKIGAKSKKDPHIKVAGLPDDIQKAKQMIMSVLDTKTSRVTLKMDVSFTDHSHIIGKGGNSIKKVMQETGCHIHFPDSNRTSADKSNQVSIAGPPLGVEAARDQMRKLLPIVLMFEIPASAPVVPDSTSPRVHQIAQEFNVTINFKQRPRSFGFIGTVRGLHSDPFAVRNAIMRLLEHLTGTVPVTVPVTTQIEIDPKHHNFMIGRNGSNIKQIMQNTGASIQFPDPNGCQGRAKSTVCITGTVESAITAKVQLMECLPLVLMFDVKEDDNDLVQEPTILSHLMETMDVLISIKAKPRQGSKSVIIKSVEKNAQRMYLARVHLLGEDPKTIPASIATLPVPPIRSNPYPPNGLGLGTLGIPVGARDLGQGLLASLGINTQSPISSPLNSKSPSPLPYVRGTSGAMPSLASLVGSYNILPSDSTPQPPVAAPTTEHEALPSNSASLAKHKLQSNGTLSNSSGLPHGTLAHHGRLMGCNGNTQNNASFGNSLSPPASSGVTPDNSLLVARSSATTEGHMMRGLSMDSLIGPGASAEQSALKTSNSATQLSCTQESFQEASATDGILHLPTSNEFSTDEVSVRAKNGGSFSESLLPRSSPNGIPSVDRQDICPSSLNSSWNSPGQKFAVLSGVRNVPYSNTENVSPDSGLCDSQSELSMSGSLSGSSLMDRLTANRNFTGANYDEKKKMASIVMQSQMKFGEIRNPTNAWSGFGFSKSMPESALKKLWSKSENQGIAKFPIARDFEQQQSPSGSLNSSASSTSSTSSGSVNGKESPPRRRSTQGPPPGLEGSKPAFEGAALLLNNNIDFTSVLQPESSTMSTLAAVQDLGELLAKLGLDRYIEVFQEQEVDFTTFMSLTDDDLKELGVSTFGARRKMILAIQDLQKIHVQRSMPTTATFSRPYAPDSSPRFNPRPLSIDHASHSLRW